MVRKFWLENLVVRITRDDYGDIVFGIWNLWPQLFFKLNRSKYFRLEGNISREFTFSGIISCHQNTETIIFISIDPLLNSFFSSKSHISTLNTINIVASTNSTSMLIYQKTSVAEKMKIKIELLESVVVKVDQNFNNITFSERGLIFDQIF